MNEELALSGLRVFDASQGIAGPHATMLMALHGADVIKIEPLEGDWCRVLGQATGRETASYLAFNQGKRSLACDLKSAAGVAASKRLLETCDIVVESFRPGVADKLGLGFEQIRASKPAVIYTSVSGFGQHGPLSLRPAVDGVIQAYSGMMEMNRTPDGKPHRVGMVAVDVATGLYAFQATLAAVLRRFRYGKGARLDVSMAQSAAAFQASKIVEHWQSEGRPQALYAPAGVFETADSSVYISGMRNEHFAALCRVLGREDLIHDPRWPTQEARSLHSVALNDALCAELSKKSTSHWLAELHRAGVLAESVCSYADWLQSAHTQATEGYEWRVAAESGRFPFVKVPAAPVNLAAGPVHPAPMLGEHTRPVLAELGFEAAWIDQHLSSGAFRSTERG